MESEYMLKMENISKSFGDNKALDDVTFTIKPGEIHALMGENGAGKSTLMKILFGMPVIFGTGGFEGQIFVEGEPVNINDPQKAMELGIGMVHQEFMLIPGFSIAENIKIGREETKPNVASVFLGKNLETLNRKQMNADARKALDTIGINIPETQLVEGLPVGHKQFIEIAREIDKTNTRILILDEPTAVLTESEAEGLLEAMRVISAKGIAIVFISHRLGEVIAVTDTVTILRDGKFISSKPTTQTDTTEIATMMVGREVVQEIQDGDDRVLSDNDLILTLKDFKVIMPGERVRDVNLSVRRGEIIGIGGLAGQGKVGIPNGIMGIHPASGDITFKGEKLNLKNYGEAIQRGIAFVSEDRQGVGLLLDENISYNIGCKALQIQKMFLRSIGPLKMVNHDEMNKHAQNMIETFDIRTTGYQQNVDSLSGGNKQKVCLACAVSLSPELLIVSEPTRGIDIGAKTLVLDYLVNLNRTKGTTIIMVSSELVELRSICDRIAVITEGEVAAILPPTASGTEFGLAMSGKVKKGGESA